MPSLAPFPAVRMKPARAIAVGAAAWLIVALLFSLQGQVESRYRGAAQPWWPSFGYTLAICAVWALMTPLAIALVRQCEARVRRRAARILVYAAGLPAANLIQVFLFALIFWPWFNDGGRIATRWEMGERMILLNLHTNALFYAGLVGGAWLMRRRRTPLPAPAAPAPAPGPAPEPAAVRVVSRGQVRIVPIERIAWIGAAGNYAEIHSDDGSFLADESLSGLAARLPADRFARIHRGAIVRIDRIEAVRSLGRGDARVTLRGGVELRLSRRYRGNLRAWLEGGGR